MKKTLLLILICINLYSNNNLSHQLQHKKLIKGVIINSGYVFYEKENLPSMIKTISNDFECIFIVKAKLNINIERAELNITKASCFYKNKYHEYNNIKAFIYDGSDLHYGIKQKINYGKGIPFSEIKINTKVQIFIKEVLNAD